MASQPGRDGLSSPHPAWAPGHAESEDQLSATKVGGAAAPRQRHLSLEYASRAPDKQCRGFMGQRGSPC